MGRVVKFSLWTALLLLFALPSCMTTRKVNYLQTGGGVPEYVDTLEYKSYRLQKGDYLYIRVYTSNAEDQLQFNGTQNNQSLLSGSGSGDNAFARLYYFLVDEQGEINYPYVGKIPVLGLETREVKYVVESHLDSILSGFAVDVKLMNRTFSVIGEAGSGRYTIPKEKLTVFQALAMSGDMSLYAKRNKIQLIRQTESGTVVKTFDLRAKSIIDSEYYYIQPNDVIYVPFDDAKYFGVTHFTGLLSLIISTFSFGLLIYGLFK